MNDEEIQNRPDMLLISDSVLTVANPEEDMRGKRVVDAEGHDLGTVDDLWVDANEVKVRFLRVASGGILGIGVEHSVIPVDAVNGITEDEVRIGQSRSQVADAPTYNPELVDSRFWDNVYAHYNYRPFYGKGYQYPGYPFYP